MGRVTFGLVRCSRIVCSIIPYAQLEAIASTVQEFVGGDDFSHATSHC